MQILLRNQMSQISNGVHSDATFVKNHTDVVTLNYDWNAMLSTVRPMNDAMISEFRRPIASTVVHHRYPNRQMDSMIDHSLCRYRHHPKYTYMHL